MKNIICYKLVFKSRLFYRNLGNKKMSVGTPVLSLKLDTAPDTLSPPLNLHFTTINKVSYTTGSEKYRKLTDNFKYVSTLYCFCWELMIFRYNFTVATDNCCRFWYLLMFLRWMLVIIDLLMVLNISNNYW